MAKSSRVKRRAKVRSPRRSRGPVLWYVVTAFVVVIGIALIVVSRPDTGSAGIQLGEHWHAALGVYDCDRWLGDGTVGDGLWQWPAATSDNRPARVGTSAYAGLHSHADGIVHMEPATSEEAGDNATLGRYFRFGGWRLDEDGYEFLGTERAAGDECGDEPGALQWSVNGEARTGNPADYVMKDGDVVVVAFLPEGKDLADIGEPPSVANLADAANIETPPGVMPTVTNPPSTGPPGGDTSTTGAPGGDASTTTAPAGEAVPSTSTP